MGSLEVIRSSASVLRTEAAKAKKIGMLGRAYIVIVSRWKNNVAPVLAKMGRALARKPQQATKLSTGSLERREMWTSGMRRCADVLWQPWQKLFPDFEKCDIFRLGKDKAQQPAKDLPIPISGATQNTPWTWITEDWSVWFPIQGTGADALSSGKNGSHSPHQDQGLT